MMHNEDMDTANVYAKCKWYDEYPKDKTPIKHSKSVAEVFNLQAEGKRYLDAESNSFHLKQSKTRDSEALWLKTALTQGTSSDKVAASIVFIQDNPKYNLSRLTSLVSQVRATKHNHNNMLVVSLKDLFLTELLHPKWKLLKFEEHNLNDIDNTSLANVNRNKILAHWYFEDQLREQYINFVSSLSAVATESVDAHRDTAISVMTDLLIGNAEQEQKLLQILVNKVGDPSGKVGSKAVFCLNRILQEHPNMNLVVLREVEKLLFRKNVGHRAQYYAICLLTRFVLNRGDEEISASLIRVYFAFFKACLKKGEPDSRMMAAILTGVNRAYPFAKIDSHIIQDHIDSVYKVVHIGSFNVSLNALTLLHQVTGNNVVQSNRFYSAFYRKLLDPQIAFASKRAVFLNLLFHVLRKDDSVERLRAFIKRILQIILYYPANMTCAVLYVISKVIHSRKTLKTILTKLNVYVKIEENDLENKKLSNHDLAESTPVEETTIKKEKDSIILSNLIIESDSAVLEKHKSEVTKDTTKTELDISKEYDPFCRNPLYAHANKCINAELIALSKHYHPSVALFAKTLLQGTEINYTGDPLEDLTLIRFLDRYVFKNPKKLEDKRIQKKNDPLAHRAGYAPLGVRSIPVDSPAYIKEREEHIPVDELYLYHYLKKRNESKHLYNTNNDDDNESVNSEEFNEMLDKFSSNKEVGDFDIAGDIGTTKSKRIDRSPEAEHEDTDDSNESVSSDVFDDNDNDEATVDLSDVDLSDLDDDDLSDMHFDGSSEDDSVDTHVISKKKHPNIAKTNVNQKNKSHKKRGKMDNIFVSAERFAEMLEEHGRETIKHGTGHTLSSLDGASFKQIDWEMKRNHRLMHSTHGRKRKFPIPNKNKNEKKIKH